MWCATLNAMNAKAKMSGSKSPVRAPQALPPRHERESIGEFCRREGRRLRLDPDTISARIAEGWYRGMKLLKLNARRIFVLKPGVCRNPLPRAAGHYRTKVRRGAYRQGDVREPNANAKYVAWMSFEDCGGKVFPHQGSY